MSSGTTITTNRPTSSSVTKNVTDAPDAAVPAPVVPSIQLTSKPRQRFSEEDDRRIILAVSDPMYCKSKGQRQSLLGIDASWTKIAREVFGGKFKRESIRTRYRRKLHPNLKQGRWTAEEDQRLMALYSRIGGQWTTISAEMDFERNDLQCRDRYSMLIRKMKKSENAQGGGGNGDGNGKKTGVPSAKTTARKNGIINVDSRMEVDETTQSSSSSASQDSPTTAMSVSSPSSSVDSLNRTSSLSTVFNVPASPLTPLSSCSSSVMMYGAYQSSTGCNSNEGTKMGAEQATTTTTTTTTLATTKHEQAKSPTSPQRLVDNELIKGVSDLMVLQKHAAHVVIHEQYRQLMYYRYWMMCHYQYQQQQQQLQFPLQQQQHQQQQQLQEYPTFVQYDQTAMHMQQQQQQFPPMTAFPQISFCPSPSQPMDIQQVQAQTHGTTTLMQLHHTPAPEEIESGMITPISASTSNSQPFDVARESTNAQTTPQTISRGRGSYYYRGFKFTEGADAKLLAAINSLRYRINGGAEVDWSSIAKEEFQGLAAPSMLQRRYLRAMHPNLRHDDWTPEEDQKLLQLHANHGGQWLTISEGMNFTRSDYQCRKRFQELTGQKNSSTSKKCAKRSHSNSGNSNGSNNNGAGSGDMSESDDGTSPIGINAAAAAAMSVLTGEPACKRLRCDENMDKSVEDLLPEAQQQQQQQQVCSVIKQVLQNQPRLSM